MCYKITVITNTTSYFRVGVGSDYNSSTRICLNCDENSLTQCVAYVNQFEHLSNTMEIMQLTKASTSSYSGVEISGSPQTYLVAHV